MYHSDIYLLLLKIVLKDFLEGDIIGAFCYCIELERLKFLIQKNRFIIELEKYANLH